MTVLIRTRDVPAAQRYDAWRSIVCDTLGPLDMRSDPDVPLQGEIAAGHLGPVNVGQVLTSALHSVRRTPGLSRRGGSELYRVVLATSGALRLAQDGRMAQLRPGQFAIYDFARPYGLVYDSAVRLAVIGLPRVHRAAPRRDGSGSRRHRGREPCFPALSVPAVCDPGHHGGRLDPAAAPRAGGDVQDGRSPGCADWAGVAHPVMLLTEPAFASFASRGVADATAQTEVILVLGLERPDQVDELVRKALAAGASPAGVPHEGDGRYQRGFADLDGHHWEALCLVEPAA